MITHKITCYNIKIELPHAKIIPLVTCLEMITVEAIITSRLDKH